LDAAGFGSPEEKGDRDMRTRRATRTAPRPWRRIAPRLALLAVLGFAAGGCDEEILVFDCPVPDAPVDVYSITGDEAVTVLWTGVSLDATDGYVVYRSRTPGGTYVPVGETDRDYFVDRSVRNGRTYYYAITAYNACDIESELSWEIAMDTPRPEGYDARLYDANGDEWRRSGWDFSSYRPVPWDAASADIIFLFDEGTPFILAADTETDIQDAGYSRFDEVGWAPERGWIPSGSAEAVAGHIYVVWTRNNHFAKVRVNRIDRGRVEFDWAYQVDPGNPELKPRSREENGPLRRGLETSRGGRNGRTQALRNEGRPARGTK